MSAVGGALPGIVLASGGARGITARCVVALARRYGWRFVLLGRTPVLGPLPAWAGVVTVEAEIKEQIALGLAADPERAGAAVRAGEIQRCFDLVQARLEIDRTLWAVAEAGGTAEYVSVDVSDPAGTRENLAPVLARHGGVVGGLLHGAGALADRKLEHKRASDFERVFAPKVRGLRALLGAVDLETLRFVVLFSSAAAYFGNAGQADYALANEVLNKAAYRLRARLPRCRVVAIDWGPWGGGAGMVTPAVEALFAARGVAFISPEAGSRVVCDALDPGASTPTQLLVGSPMPPPAVPLEGIARTHRILRRLDEHANPFLRDHVIAGRAVLPVTCAMAWIADACEARYPGWYAVRLEDCRVLGGVVLDAGPDTELVLELSETARGADELNVTAEVAGRGASGLRRLHYRSRVVLAHRRADPPRKVPASSPPRLGGPLDGAELYRDGTLFHGASFRGVERVLSLDECGLALACRLPAVPESVQGQFLAGSANPYVADTLFQGLVIWARRMRGAASLPVFTTRVELYRPLEFDRRYTVSVTVLANEPQRLVADLDAADEDGNVHLRLAGAEVALSTTLARHFVSAGTV